MGGGGGGGGIGLPGVRDRALIQLFEYGIALAMFMLEYHASLLKSQMVYYTGIGALLARARRCVIRSSSHAYSRRMGRSHVGTSQLYHD